MIYAAAVLLFGFLCTLYAFLRGRHRNIEAGAVCFLALVANTSVQSISGSLMPLWWFIGIDTMAGVFLLARATRRWEVILALLFLASVIAHVVVMLGGYPPRPYLDFINALVYLQFATIVWGVRHDARKFGQLTESGRDSDGHHHPGRAGEGRMGKDR